MKVTVNYGYGNTVTKEVAEGTTYAQLLGDPNLKAVLGYGCNFQALDEYRRVINQNHTVRAGTVSLETIANTKGNEDGVSVTVTYGYGNELTKVVPHGSTVGDILNNRDIQAVLGFGKNVKALIDRVEQPVNAPIRDGDEIAIETVANTKGLVLCD